MPGSAQQQRREQRAPDEIARSNRCDQECRAVTEAAEIRAAATDRMTDAIIEATKTFQPVADAAAETIHKLNKLCLWVRKWGVAFLISAPWIITLAGGLTPRAAKLFDGLFRMMGM